MTSRHRDLDNLADRLSRAANTVPQAYAHLDEQRGHVSVLAAHAYDRAPGGGSSVVVEYEPDPDEIRYDEDGKRLTPMRVKDRVEVTATERTVLQLDRAATRRSAIADAIATLSVCVNMLEREIAAARSFRVSVHDDNLDHLDGTPRCNTPGCDQIPTPRPDGAGGTIDDGRCLDCGKRYDEAEAARIADRRQHRAQLERNRYGRV